MNLEALLSIYSKHKGVVALRKICSETADGGKRRTPVTAVEGLQGSAAAMAFAALRQSLPTGRPMLFVLNDEEEAGYFYHDLVQLLGDTDVLFFPSSYRRAVKYARRDSANEILRTEVLNRLAETASQLHNSTSSQLKPPYIVTYPAAIAERVAAATDYRSNAVSVSEGGQQDPEELGKKLLDMGFRRCDYVYEPGEFAVRGSIVDVFSYSSEYPFRIDFFGDDVESIRTFEVQTQLSRDRQHDVTIVGDVGHTASSRVPFTDCLPADTLLVVRDFGFVHEMVSRIYDEGFSHQAEIEREGEEGASADELNRNVQLTDGATLLRGLLPLQRIEIGSHHATDKAEMPRAVVRFNTKPQPLFHKNFQLLHSTLASLHEEQYRVFVLADSAKQNERLRSILDELGSSEDVKMCSCEEDVKMWSCEDVKNGASAISSEQGHSHSSSSQLHNSTSSQLHNSTDFTPLTPTLHEGFTDETLRLAVFTDHQIFDRFHKYNLHSDHARDAKMALTLKELMQFQPGDYVVHIDHGVGRFAGLVRVPSADGSMQEMIKLTYKNDDVVFVSIHALHKVSKYKGREGEPPRLSHLGTGAWEKLKDRTKKKIKDIARDLISLYSRRREEQGFAFSADSFMQHELEAGFAYEDTPDQLRVTQEVKADMERPQPMDRLVCGDVGFGKTEIAVRAALKAAADNKQVAVLVPTTVLALQHYNTFTHRLKDFPVRIDYLSRARTTAQSREILKDLADGKIDILIGTHKLIGKSVKWHDLGLLIIDEEQKFGVSVKERLRQVKVNVDTLTMSATPIPRTLQFSLMGARDLSVIQTPPPNRRPIQTEVHTFSHEIVADAVNFEMSRNGQVYIVTNRVAQLGTLAALVHKYVPDARIATGHGQMPPAELEKIILGFVNYDYDVLISTTIVENGIDIPNANTIIIDAAQHFGLSDLHQMRGRVGRSNRKAFCYLLAPPLHMLPDDARRRLEAIENFSDLGSGIHIAMQDLDIRGAGNLLGAEQSGFIADLGYETYQKILAEAVSELRNEGDSSQSPSPFPTDVSDGTPQSTASITPQSSDETVSSKSGVGTTDASFFVADCSIECDMRAYLPETYVPGAAERMLLYRELDGLTTDADLAAYRQRLEDRFGPLPPEAEELMRVSPLRREGRRVGAERITLKNGRMTLYFVSNADSPFYRSEAFTRVINYATTHYHRCALAETNGKRRMTIKEIHSVSEALDVISEMV